MNGQGRVIDRWRENYPWVVEIREGIDPLLSKTARIEYFYLNTKKNWSGGSVRAKEAYRVYKRFAPDGVIAADDDAQAMFVVPFLKNRVVTPVIFCGVNADPAKYDYPAANVTGILEREPMKQSLLFLSQLAPTVKTFGFISKDSPTATAVEMQLNAEKASYPIAYVGSRVAANLHEAMAVAQSFKTTCDALLYITMEGLPDKNGKPLSDAQVMPALVKSIGIPVITNAMYRVKYGALSAVVKTGQEHGRVAAEMLLKAMRGTPISDLPITQNRFGQRIINVDTMTALGIKPRPQLIRSATLVRTEQ